MKRRDFLVGVGAGLAASALPLIVRSDSLEPPVPVNACDVVPLILWGDGFHDDSRALQALINGEEVFNPDGRPVGNWFEGRVFRVPGMVDFTTAPPNRYLHFTNCRFEGEGTGYIRLS